jgi:peptide/nickel transport system permease protein
MEAAPALAFRSPRLRAAARYWAQRFIHALLLLIAVSFFSFVLLQLSPGDFLAEMRVNPTISPETIAGLRRQYGLDQPLHVQYLAWLASAVQGEFGFSFAYNSPVGPLLLGRALNTALLGGVATLIAWLIAVPVGVWSAERQGSRTEAITSLTNTTLLATPDLLLALAALLFAVSTGWLPAGGMTSVGFQELPFLLRVKDVGVHLLLPTAALVLGIVPMLIRHVRAALLDVLDAPFIRNAEAHGISRGRLVFRHALPVAGNTLASLFGFSLALLLSGSLIVEIIMSWPGMGPLLLEAVLGRDIYVVIGSVVLSTCMLVFGSLISDLLLFLLDPRIRFQS